MENKTTIVIRRDTLDDLKQIGEKGEDSDSIIARLIVEHNSHFVVNHSLDLINGRKDDFVDIDEL
jgi:hypothetical protein